MWIFCYFRNQLCPCDVVSRGKEDRQNVGSLTSKVDKQCGTNLVKKTQTSKETNQENTL